MSETKVTSETSAETKPKTSTKSKVMLGISIVLLLAVVGVAVAVCVYLASVPSAASEIEQGVHDGGASIKQAQEGESAEEIEARLSQKAQESRMKISCAAKCKIEGGKVKVNVKNDETNKFDQSFELVQNGEIIYSSGLISPGESVEWCEAPNAQSGEATIKIHAHKDGAADNFGSAQAAAVELYIAQ